MLVVSSETSSCDLLLRPPFSCFQELVLRPQTDVATSLSFVILFASWSQLLFHVATSLVVLSFQAGHESKLLVCLFSCRDVNIRSRPSIFFNHCNSCRDLKSMLRPSFLPIQSQPHFSVSTVPFNFSISGRDMTVLLCFGIYVVT